jgi:hypothetical protein
MARAVYQHELQDQDFAWLIQRFQDANPEFILIESNVLPLVFFRVGEKRVRPEDFPLVLGTGEDYPEDESVSSDPDV